MEAPWQATGRLEGKKNVGSQKNPKQATSTYAQGLIQDLAKGVVGQPTSQK